MTSRSVVCTFLLAFALPAAALAAPPPAPAACTVRAVTFDGWKAEQLQNHWVTLDIVPQLGGRLMQVTFAGHKFLFVNPKLKGKDLPSDTVHHAYLGYGGDKLWPMPEGPPAGTVNERQWPGAGGEPLNDLPFKLQVLSDASQPGGANGPVCKVRLTGPVDPLIGQRYIRQIGIGSDSPAISFHAVMENVSGYPQRWGVQSVTQYNASDPNHPGQYNPQFFGIVQANPHGPYLLGYHIRFGKGGNPAYTVAHGLFRLHFGPVGGEVWTDTAGGWLAVVDGTTGFTMVERDRYQPQAHYPGHSPMLFYTTGARRNPRPASAAPAQPQRFYMEAEANSPVVQLAPGQSYAFNTTWYPTRMGSDFAAVHWGGVVGQALAAKTTPQGLNLTGEFGVFYPGQLVAHFYDYGGQAIGTQAIGAADPTQPLKLNATVAAPPGTARVSLHVVDPQGLDRGPLGEAFVNPPPPRRQQSD